MSQHQLKSNSLSCTRLYVQFNCDEASNVKGAKCLFLHLEVSEFEDSKKQTKKPQNLKGCQTCTNFKGLEFKNI